MTRDNLVENPILGISTIEIVKDHSPPPPYFACCSWDANENLPKKRPLSAISWIISFVGISSLNAVIGRETHDLTPQQNPARQALPLLENI